MCQSLGRGKNLARCQSSPARSQHEPCRSWPQTCARTSPSRGWPRPPRTTLRAWDRPQRHGIHGIRGSRWPPVTQKGPGIRTTSAMDPVLGPRNCKLLIWSRFNSCLCSRIPTMSEVSLPKRITARSTWAQATAAKPRSLWRESPGKDQLNPFRRMWMRCAASWDCNMIVLWNCWGFQCRPITFWTLSWSTAPWGALRNYVKENEESPGSKVDCEIFLFFPKSGLQYGIMGLTGNSIGRSCHWQTHMCMWTNGL